MKQRALWLTLAFGVALLLLARLRYPGMIESDQWLRVTYLLAWVALFGGGMLAAFRRDPAKAGRNALLWVVIFLGLMCFYDVMTWLTRR